MRIAFPCKRQYMGKDVILDRYARLYEIPHQLAGLGHSVKGYCLDYHSESDGEWSHEGSPDSLDWESRSLGVLKLPRLIAFPGQLLKRLHAFQPNVIIGASDIPRSVGSPIFPPIRQALLWIFMATSKDSAKPASPVSLPLCVGRLDRPAW